MTKKHFHAPLNIQLALTYCREGWLTHVDAMFWQPKFHQQDSNFSPARTPKTPLGEEGEGMEVVVVGRRP
jgi:hypothetical protein